MTKTREVDSLIPVRKAELAHLDAPTCSVEGHGLMVPRPLDHQTYEQMFCGTWYDCKHLNCRNSRLTVSLDLAHQLKAGRSL